MPKTSLENSTTAPSSTTRTSLMVHNGGPRHPKLGDASQPNMIDYVFSGHESFSLRISWLPKAAAALEEGKDPFSDPREGMLLLGLGKNMVQSLSYWTLATGLACKSSDRMQLTDFGRFSIARAKGADPYLENSQTLWLLHWNLCQGWLEGAQRRRWYAWHYFSNLLTSDEITATDAVDHYAAGPALSTGKPLSSVTLRQHFDVFVRTYVGGERSGPRSTPEDCLDSPLTTLGLIKASGERTLPNGKRETVYRIRTGPKGALSHETFRHCLNEWWTRTHPGDATLTVRQIAHDDDSPGRCFRLPESEIYQVLFKLARLHPKEFQLVESQNQRAVCRNAIPSPAATLKAIYRKIL